MVPDEDQGRFPDLLAALAWWLLPSQRGAVMAEMELLTNTFLPPGKTCADCVHCRRCCALFGQTPNRHVLRLLAEPVSREHDTARGARRWIANHKRPNLG
jgi:hypothetical protein